jgi:hypothetical protein
MAVRDGMLDPKTRSVTADAFLRVMARTTWPEMGRRDADQLCGDLFSWATCDLEPRQVRMAATVLASTSQIRPPGPSCGNYAFQPWPCRDALSHYFSTCFFGREDVAWGFVEAAEQLDEYHGGLRRVVDRMLPE